MSTLNIGFDNHSPQHVDRSYGKTIGGRTTPYASVAEANTAVVSAYRHKGKTVLIDLGSGAEEYWWKNGITDVDLIVKADVSKPWKVVLTSNGSYVLPAGMKISEIILTPGEDMTLRIGTTADGEEIMPDELIAGGTDKSVLISIIARTDKTIYFSGIISSVTILLYRGTLTPTNP